MKSDICYNIDEIRNRGLNILLKIKSITIRKIQIIDRKNRTKVGPVMLYMKWIQWPWREEDTVSDWHFSSYILASQDICFTTAKLGNIFRGILSGKETKTGRVQCCASVVRNGDQKEEPVSFLMTNFCLNYFIFFTHASSILVKI